MEDKMKTFFLILVSFVMISFSLTETMAQDNTVSATKIVMHRYLVERTFPDGLNIPLNQVGKDLCLTVVSNNAEDNVTWVHSYVTLDKKKTFCIYDAPSPDAIRKSAKVNGLPVDNIIEVSVLDPYFYK